MSIVSLNQTLTAVLVDTLGLLYQCLADLYPTPMSGTVTVSVDLEGINLSRFGRICVLQIMRAHSNMVWLIDVTTLGGAAFEETDQRGINLKYILECTEVEKLFFDVRNDSDALYSLYGIGLSNVYDLQILELAVRLSNGRRVNLITGLRRAIQEFLIPPQDWVKVKETGNSLFAPEKGGKYEVFETRPLDPRLIAYCAQDVTLLYILREAMRSRMGTKGLGWEQRVCNESYARVMAATQPNYLPDGPHKIMAPRCW
ncbi:hypothetical protein AX16_005302 [Volvariella volvacea WC 439]|nr:hypothetical protein AX16_005302 [Volvariella volvacea WC 439]